jgi:hypothetical protein
LRVRQLAGEIDSLPDEVRQWIATGNPSNWVIPSSTEVLNLESRSGAIDRLRSMITYGAKIVRGEKRKTGRYSRSIKHLLKIPEVKAGRPRAEADRKFIEMLSFVYTEMTLRLPPMTVNHSDAIRGPFAKFVCQCFELVGTWTGNVSVLINEYGAERRRRVLDFDGITGWFPHLKLALADSVTEDVIALIRSAKVAHSNDAYKLLLDLVDRDEVVDAILTWLRSSVIAGYHGTRLTDLELASVIENGLIPLKAENRKERIIRVLSSHPDWPTASKRLGRVLQDFGARNRGGHIEGQVHLTLSRAGLVKGFNRYLRYGSEFDLRVADELVGVDARDLLARDGTATIFRIEVPGAAALTASHRYFGIEALRERGEVPNVAADFLRAWSCRLVDSKFKSKAIELDCGMVFGATIPPEWISDVERLNEKLRRSRPRP